MADAALTIAGVVRNGGAALGQTLARIEEIRGQVGSSRVYIATNDNSDSTDDVLRDHAATYPDVTILQLDSMAQRIPERVDRIAAARNAVLDAIRGQASASGFTLMLDLDGPNAELRHQDVVSSMARMPVDVAAHFANQNVAYYDLYALRCTGWCERDPWTEVRNARRGIWRRKAKKRALIRALIHDRQYRIPTDAPLIEVESAFGGLGLYRTGPLCAASYAARLPDGGLVCEHVPLNQSIRSGGHRLCIDPALINKTQTEHLGPTSGAPIPPALLQRDRVKEGA